MAGCLLIPPSLFFPLPLLVLCSVALLTLMRSSSCLFSCLWCKCRVLIPTSSVGALLMLISFCPYLYLLLVLCSLALSMVSVVESGSPVVRIAPKQRKSTQ